MGERRAGRSRLWAGRPGCGVTRQLSFTEIQTALTCEGRHAFQYTGRLTGGETLKRKQIAVELSNGRAWGAAVAAWHGFPADTSLLDAYRPVLAKHPMTGSPKPTTTRVVS